MRPLRALLEASAGALFTALAFTPSAYAQPRSAPSEKVRALPQAEAAERWREFSSSEIAGDYCMAFLLSHNPRKSESTEYRGLIFGSRRDGGTATRVTVKPAGSPKAAAADFILLNSPASSKIWRLADGKFREIPESEWGKPILDGLVFSPFDILAPYRWWKPVYKGPARMGKAVHIYALLPPGGFPGGISKVEIALTREFNSPAQTEIFGGAPSALKTVRLGAVKKLDGLWVVSELTARDNSSGDADRLKFVSGAVKINLQAEVFSVERPLLSPEVPELEIF